ncbi:carboxylesterase/lipase family protein [Actinoplanes sp. GCM10030250]|uniref:carboxylesterase/lipase family protein n=1 Tax=Actinoplanes sp. GCM10030250 TaxID=3273376 RepID=UPI003619FE28
MNPLIPLLAGAALVVPAGANTTVMTDKGAVRGTTTAAGTRSFQGIPYAAPPIRWTSPRPAAPWTGVRDATRPGPACAQPAGLPVGVPSDAEDCLYLNVTTPAGATKSGGVTTSGGERNRLPVIVWIHGGSMMFGTGDMYRPDRLAADAVVVSMNYRLGVMSFLTHPALDSGSPHGSGSLAIEDQQAALRWVRSNIRAFGGDPANVTIMGQSGGGYAVCDHLAAPGSAGLFHRAIIQSSPCAGSDGGTRTRSAAEADSTAVIKAVGCEGAPDVGACLRSPGISTASLLAAYGAWNEPRPVAGTSLLPLSPAEAFRTGRFNRVPVLIGVNHDEENGRYAVAPPIAAEAYEPTVREQFGPRSEAVLARYPLSDHDNSAGLALATISTDRGWAVPTYQTAELLTRWTSTHMYEFAERDTPWFVGYPAPDFPWRAQHMSELAYLFDLDLFEPRSAAQNRLASRMVATWTRYAAEATPGWAPFQPGSPHVQSLTSGRWTSTEFRHDHKLHFWTHLPH